MLKIDLARLEREGTLRAEASVPSDDPLWEGSKLKFEGPLYVELTASLGGSGQVVVRGLAEGHLDQQCRRCLKPVHPEVHEEFTVIFVPRDELELEGEGGELKVLPPETSKLDVGEAVREELMLSIDRFVVCDPDCRGLCPQCGTDLNEEECECTTEELDPRWDALRALKNE